MSRILAAVDRSVDSGSEINSLAKLQTLVDQINGALGVITAYAQSDGATAAPTENTFVLAGVESVSANNLPAILNALRSSTVQGPQTDTKAEVQAVVSAYNAILAEANGSAADSAAASNPSSRDYGLIGATQASSLADGSPAQSLLNSVIGQLDRQAVDSIAEIEALASIVQRLMLTAAGTPSAAAATPAGALSAADFSLLGLTGVTSANLSVVLGAIASSANNGTEIDTVDELQTLILSTIRTAGEVQAALGVIQAYADNPGSSLSPTLATYAVAGVTGVSLSNLGAINSALASIPVGAAQVDTLSELQTLVNAFNRILDEANGSAKDLTAADPTAAQYALIGANIGLAAQSTTQGVNALALLNDGLGAQQSAAVDTVAKIDALAAAVTGIVQTAAGGIANPALTADDFSRLGITAVTQDNLASVLAAIAASADDGSQVNSLSALQALVTSAASQFAALQEIATYADSNAPLADAPSLAVFAQAGVIGVDNSNRLAIASALASAAVSGALADSQSEVQSLVDAYRLILAEANGFAIDSTPASAPSSGTYALIGATTAASLADHSAAQRLLNDVIANLSASAVDRVSKIDSLATTAQTIADLAALSIPPNPMPALLPSQLEAFGINGVT
ncbi:MAG: hypothetical protein KGR68_18630, partial [Betaproteobacteria bacterium]|nr:hypothetical protein [Betaproteobacteria bacterium]